MSMAFPAPKTTHGNGAPGALAAARLNRSTLGGQWPSARVMCWHISFHEVRAACGSWWLVTSLVCFRERGLVHMVADFYEGSRQKAEVGPANSSPGRRASCERTLCRSPQVVRAESNLCSAQLLARLACIARQPQQIPYSMRFLCSSILPGHEDMTTQTPGIQTPNSGGERSPGCNCPSQAMDFPRSFADPMAGWLPNPKENRG